MNLAELRSLLEKGGLRLHRERGQSFIIDPAQAERLVRLAGIGPDDSVLEVGTGLGALTRAIASVAARVLSIEIDSGLVRMLLAESLLPENVELRHADALALDLPSVLAEMPAPRRMVANLPYSAATPLLRRTLECAPLLDDWSVMLQREVAQRLSAEPGAREYGSLAVIHRLSVEIEVLGELGPRTFFPAPKIASSFVRLTPRRCGPLREGELAAVERVARAAFSQRRKTLWNAMRGGGFGGDASAALESALEQCGIDPGTRAEKLEPEQFLALSRALAVADPAA